MPTPTTVAERGASAKAIGHHYDVGNEFYHLWLDSSLSYSCALWEERSPEESLEQAQQRKIDYHIGQARAHGVARVLDIGCGWGAVICKLVEQCGVQRAVGLTLSQQQAEYLAQRRDPRIKRKSDCISGLLRAMPSLAAS